MGVTGLWTVLQPCARPIKIETLNKKRLAVDASIWIYQFLKAVRDKEGNALRNSHIVGFFRRVCKLLFIGIKPVFVFDGGAPALKRQTIQHRKARREGRREDAVRTAGKLLAIQIQRAAEDEDRKRKDAARRAQDETPHPAPEEEIPKNVVYAEELFQTEEERAANRTSTFRRKDQYHLPDLGRSMSEMGAANDPRVMSLEELEEYARNFEKGEDINVYDFSKIDFDGIFFQSLPAADRYNILNAARLRSRLRMGHSKEQLDAMFPDRMAFSKFQIERVRERNDLTQRLMNLNGMNDDAFDAGSLGRVAGERDREYVLVKNDGVEGGWALGVVQKDEGTKQKPILVDKPPAPPKNDEEIEEDEEFEDVPIEGLNRLPKLPPGMSAKEREGREFIANELATRRRRFYQSRRDKHARPQPRGASLENRDPDSLFLAEDDEEQVWENVTNNDGDGLFQDGMDDEENDQLQQAIALSMQPEGRGDQDIVDISDDDEPIREVFQQKRAVELNPFASQHKPKGLAAIARMANQQSSKATPTGPFEGSDSDEDEFNPEAALEKRSFKLRQPSPKLQVQQSLAPAVTSAPKSRHPAGFDGPLPFEKLNLGNSLLGKKKMEKLEADTAGGFEKDSGRGKDKTVPLPPWFKGERDITAELAATRQEENDVWEKAREEERSRFQFPELPRLHKNEMNEVIDLDTSGSPSQKQMISLESEKEDAHEQMEHVLTGRTRTGMDDVAEDMRGKPLKSLPPQQKPSLSEASALTAKPFADESEDEAVEWSESEAEEERGPQKVATPTREASRSPSEEFEDVPMLGNAATAPVLENSPSPEFEDVPMGTRPTSRAEALKSPSLEVGDATIVRATHSPRSQRGFSPAKLEGPDDLLLPIAPPDAAPDDTSTLALATHDSDQYSDPEDAELFASLTQEASEHARFAQELNATTTVHVNFDEELKQLRAQQKKDRRDADEVTQTMIQECQHLLSLFGLPYITAPMEAEAQCAELVSLGLVDGIVTDDSDTFLFGGTRVYKNMFNAAKYVECYLASDLLSSFQLSRDKLISIAQLLGSDYTPGIPGIGPVTALEILSEFPSLESFTQWWTTVQSCPQQPPATPPLSPFLKRFRKSHATKLFLPPSFPDTRVAHAYLHPDVDSDPQPFVWGVPDLAALRSYLQAQIGWSQERTDEVLVPVIRDMNRRAVEGTQSNITRFFEGGVGVGVRGLVGGGVKGNTSGRGKGGRMGAALARLADGAGASGVEEGRQGKKRKARMEMQDPVNVYDEDEDEEVENNADEAHVSAPRRKRAKPPAKSTSSTRRKKPRKK